MSYFHGYRPVYFVLFVSVAVWSWTATVFADTRVPLTIAEAEDLATAGEPGIAALLARSHAANEEAVAAEHRTRQFPDRRRQFQHGRDDAGPARRAPGFSEAANAPVRR